ncbi:hypothetical protein HDU97_008193 [Phlyctochytrium planicorne]|nr:hypothetical protein HDU97_008193 [Phlyctochytrium planicorne]
MGINTEKSRRVPACGRCRSQKVKCDGTFPGCFKRSSVGQSQHPRVPAVARRTPPAIRPLAIATTTPDVLPISSDAWLSSLPTPTFRDPLHPLSLLLEQVTVSFALEDHLMSWKNRVKKAVVEESLAKGSMQDLVLERLMLQRYFEWQRNGSFEVVHRRTVLENLDKQPAILRYALCSMAGQLSMPQAPRPVVLSYFNRAKDLTKDIVDECSVENAQACFILSIVATALGNISTSYRMLELSARMAEYLQLYLDPGGNTALTWTEKESRRRLWWAIHFYDKMSVIMAGRPSLIPETSSESATVLPMCENDIFFSLDPSPANEPEPAPLSEGNLLNQLVVIGERIQNTVRFTNFKTVQELEVCEPELKALEAELLLWHDRLPPHLSNYPSELAIHSAFTSNYRFEGMFSDPNIKICSTLIPVTSQTRSAKGDLWDQVFLHSLYFTLQSLLHRPRLLLYSGIYRLPAVGSPEQNLLNRAIDRAEKSAGALVTMTDCLLRSGLAFSEHPSLLVIGNRRSIFERNFKNITKSQVEGKTLRGCSLSIPGSPSSTFSGSVEGSPAPSSASSASSAPSMPVSEMIRVWKDGDSRHRPYALFAPELYVHPFMRFTLLINSMVLVDLASLQHRLDPNPDTLKVYLQHCHIGISVMRRLMRSEAFFWHVGEEYLRTISELLDSVERMGSDVGVDDMYEFWFSEIAMRILDGSWLHPLNIAFYRASTNNVGSYLSANLESFLSSMLPEGQRRTLGTSSPSSCNVCTVLSIICDGSTPGCTRSRVPSVSTDRTVQRHRRSLQARTAARKRNSSSPSGSSASVTPRLNHDLLLKIMTQQPPNITFRDPFHPLSMYLDQINISFALDDHFLKWKRSIKRAVAFEEAKASSTERQFWAERMMIENFFRWQKSCCFEVVHRRTFLNELDSQPPLLRYAMAAMAGRLAVPQAPHVLVRSYFEKALALVPDAIEDCSLENAQACVLLSIVAANLGNTVAAHRVLDFAARTAEYLQLYKDPNEFEEFKNLPWTEKEIRRRVWWAIFFLDKMALIMFGRPSIFPESRRSSFTVLPTCDNDTFSSLDLDPLTINDPPPVANSEANQLINLLEIGEKARAVLGSRIFQTVEELGNVTADLTSLESDLMAWFDRLPPSLARYPTELDVHRAFLPDDASFVKMLSENKVQKCAVILPVNPEWTKSRQSTTWDHLMLHAIYNALVCLLHRPRLLLYAGNYRLPAPNSMEETLLQRAVDKAQKSAGWIATITEHIVRAGVAFSKDPTKLMLRTLSLHEACFRNISKAQQAFKRRSTLASEALKTPYVHIPGADPVNVPFVSSMRKMADPKTSHIKSPEVQVNSFLMFPLLIGSMVMADLAVLQRRVDPYPELVKVYHIPCYIGISLMSRLMASIVCFNSSGEHSLGVIVGLLVKMERMEGLDQCWQSDFAKNVLSGRYNDEAL